MKKIILYLISTVFVIMFMCNMWHNNIFNSVNILQLSLIPLSKISFKNFIVKILKRLLILIIFRYSITLSATILELQEILYNFDDKSLKLNDLSDKDYSSLIQQIGNKKSEREIKFELRCIELGRIDWEVDNNGFKLEKIFKEKVDGKITFRYVFERTYPKTMDIRNVDSGWATSDDFKQFCNNYINTRTIFDHNSNKSNELVSIPIKVDRNLIDHNSNKSNELASIPIKVDKNLIVPANLNSLNKNTMIIENNNRPLTPNSTSTTSSLGEIISNKKFTFGKLPRETFGYLPEDQESINKNWVSLFSLFILRKDKHQNKNQNLTYLIVLFAFIYIFCYSFFNIQFELISNDISNNYLLDSYECFIPLIGTFKSFFSWTFIKQNKLVNTNDNDINNNLIKRFNSIENNITIDSNKISLVNTDAEDNHSLKSLIRNNNKLLEILEKEVPENINNNLVNSLKNSNNNSYLDLDESKRSYISFWLKNNFRVNNSLISQWFDSDTEDAKSLSKMFKSQWFDSDSESENGKSNNSILKSQWYNSTSEDEKYTLTKSLIFIFSCKNILIQKIIIWIKNFIVKMIWKKFSYLMIVYILPLFTIIDFEIILSVSTLKPWKGKDRDWPSEWYDSDSEILSNKNINLSKSLNNSQEQLSTDNNNFISPVNTSSVENLDKNVVLNESTKQEQKKTSKFVKACRNFKSLVIKTKEDENIFYNINETESNIWSPVYDRYNNNDKNISHERLEILKKAYTQNQNRDTMYLVDRSTWFDSTKRKNLPLNTYFNYLQEQEMVQNNTNILKVPSNIKSFVKNFIKHGDDPLKSKWFD